MTRSSLINQLVESVDICSNHLGFERHLTRTRYTGTEVRIINSPMLVSTGLATIGRMVMTRVMLR